LQATVVIVALLVVVVVWGSTVYDVTAGRTIEGRVVSCRGFSTGRTCDVQWASGSAHGTTNVDGPGLGPGDLVKLSFVPQWGVANRGAALAVAVLVPIAFALATIHILWRRRRA
jgi:hypothetical protein